MNVEATGVLVLQLGADQTDNNLNCCLLGHKKPSWLVLAALYTVPLETIATLETVFSTVIGCSFTTDWMPL